MPLLQIHFNLHFHSSTLLDGRVRLLGCVPSAPSLPTAYATDCSFFQPVIHPQNTFSASHCLWKSSQIPESNSVKFSTVSLQFYFLFLFFFILTRGHFFPLLLDREEGREEGKEKNIGVRETLIGCFLEVP